LNEAAHLGFNALLRRQEPEKYWGMVEDVILSSMKEVERVDAIIFLGPQGGNEALRQVVHWIMENHYKGKAEATNVQTTEDLLFAAARGAVAAVGREMVDGYNACIEFKTDD
jgi:hypothetical protein